MSFTAPAAYVVTLDTGTFVTDGATSILEAALAHGMAVPFSCQRGACGSCRATVQSGRFARITAATEESYVTAADELLMCQCRAASDLKLRFTHWRAPVHPPQTCSARVVSRTPLSANVMQLIVELQEASVFDYLPGQHVQLLLDDGSRRHFSIANPPGDSGAVRLEFHIRRSAAGRFSNQILPTLAPGDALTLEGPLGTCIWPKDGWDQRIEHLVLLATGTGFAGVFPVLMAALNGRQVKTVTLYWGGRSGSDCYAAPLLNALAGKHVGLRWYAALSAQHSADSPDRATDSARHGYVQELALADQHDWTRTAVYACGNPAMVRTARAQLLAAGLAPDRFLSEVFLPADGEARIDLHPPSTHAWERVGQRFTMTGILDARQRSIDAVREIATLFRPGMRTREAIAVADAHLRRLGATHNWHPTYVRFGSDTQSPAVQATDFQRMLREDDVFVLGLRRRPRRHLCRRHRGGGGTLRPCSTRGVSPRPARLAGWYQWHRPV